MHYCFHLNFLGLYRQAIIKLNNNIPHRKKNRIKIFQPENVIIFGILTVCFLIQRMYQNNIIITYRVQIDYSKKLFFNGSHT